jgi:dihydrofolate reductase
MTLSIIVAMAHNNVIGGGNTLLWKLPADFQHFKKLTMGHPIIMGRKTYCSIGRPLPGRTNIIVTRQVDFSAPGCSVTHSLEEALAVATKSHQVIRPDARSNDRAKSSDEVFCIGGGELYKQALPLAKNLYITKVDATFEGDTYFPEIKVEEWHEISRENHTSDEQNPYPYSFILLKRG